MSEPARVAVVKPCCIGDCVMALPALDALVAAYPKAALDVFVGTHSRAVFDARPTLNAVLPVAETMTRARLQRLAWRLRRGRYDWIVVLDRSRALRMASRLASPVRVAAARGAASESRHETHVYLDVVRSLGVSAPPTAPRLTPPDTARARAAQVAPVGLFVALHPGGAENPGVLMPEKRWPPERFAELARVFQAEGLEVVLTGGPGDIERCHAVAERAGLPAASVLAGQLDLLATAALIERAALYVGGDTGVSHLAAAVGTPTVAIFGPTNPRRYRPLGLHARVVAAPGAWEVAEGDLRRSRVVPPAARIDLVTVPDVRQACAELLREPSRCA